MVQSSRLGWLIGLATKATWADALYLYVKLFYSVCKSSFVPSLYDTIHIFQVRLILTFLYAHFAAFHTYHYGDFVHSLGAILQFLSTFFYILLKMFDKKVKISLLQAVEAHMVATGQDSHIT
jgi:hypothetical protein